LSHFVNKDIHVILKIHRMKLLSLSLAACLLMSGAQLPRKAYDVPINLPDGRKLNVSDYRGKVVCLAFILTT